MTPIQHTINTAYVVGPVHCYSSEINGQLVLFDTGPPSDEAKRYLQSNLQFERLQHVIITHCHIDHYGLANWLSQQTDATIYLPFRDHLKITRHAERLELMYDLILQIGFAPDFLDRFRANMGDGTVFPPLPEKFKIIEDGLPPELGLTAQSCPGHSQSDMVFTTADWAITGDVMLQAIFQTPLLDVDLLTGERFHNYAAYCESLKKLVTLRDKIILPGHRETIESVDSCLLFYLRKLLVRAGRIKNLLLNMNAADIVINHLNDDTKHPFVSYLKASEIVFLQDFMAHPERLKATLIEIGLYPQVADSFTYAIT
ncbi:Glyoxylase, beta-lactamase superfamily II [Desulfuromusa kysingii]|uniref:Glyoxylase, beta-lactamase superfamily II n=1 Tax=Desulfuromusa kysingii TaxID=37625 RepID=A0A1H4DE66_9BACT|nr:MBL fold metallo-hydrolase [Desulfuromusa kysingii]SEA71133.1 Glyoxylase, beta-lactamase superfamily II [Desulfuromusa kysingii]